MADIRDFVFNKNPMLVLSYLTKNPRKNNMATHVAKALSLSSGSVHAILKGLESSGLATSKRVGNAVLYEVDNNNPLIKSFRIFDNLLELKGLIDELKKYTRKIILFGSCSRGEDNAESDIDLFIMADEAEKDKAFKILSGHAGNRDIDHIIVDTLEFIEMEKSDAVFFNEIMKGIELWEKSDRCD